MKLAERLRAIRTEHNFTQQNMADALGIDRTTYTVYETGTAYPPIDRLCKIAQIYNVSLDFLVGADDKMTLRTTGVVSVASGSDPISMLDKDEKTLLVCYRLLDESGREQMIEYVKNFTKEYSQNKY